MDELGKPILDPGRWDQASTRVETRVDRARDVFDDALEKERSRETDLDDLFERAKRKAKRQPDTEL